MTRKSFSGNAVIDISPGECPSPRPSPRLRGEGWGEGQRQGSDRGTGADGVGDLARQELTIAGSGVELAVLDDDLAAQDRHARPSGDLVAFPRRVVGLVQILFAD